MRTVAEIKHDIEKLPAQKRRALGRWLAEEENAAWDEQMERDAAAGRLQFLIDEAETEAKAGKLRKFP
jgi:hypothetical protein